jgi:hypothetical protein
MPDHAIPPVLNLWTTAAPEVVDLQNARARDVLLDIRTGSDHRWGRIFAPPQQLTSWRAALTRQDKFVDEYENLLRARYQDEPAAFEALLERSHLILWSERPAGIGEFDHRHILVHVIRQLAARQGIRVNYRGELHPESRMGSYERIMRLMIAGSRQATPDMLAAADRTVRQAIFRGWEIMVGDNPQGVDAAVVSACKRYGANCLVAGTTRKPRNNGYPYQPMGKNFPERDRLLCELSDVGVFIWNGKSKGTRAGIRYMSDALNKPALVLPNIA